MGNVIILAILLVMVVLAVNSGRKHFKAAAAAVGRNAPTRSWRSLPSVSGC